MISISIGLTFGVLFEQKPNCLLFQRKPIWMVEVTRGEDLRDVLELDVEHPLPGASLVNVQGLLNVL